LLFFGLLILVCWQQALLLHELSHQLVIEVPVFTFVDLRNPFC
jgi:hypothetical protein